MDKLDEAREGIKTIQDNYKSCFNDCLFSRMDRDGDILCCLFREYLPLNSRLNKCIKEFGFKTEEE